MRDRFGATSREGAGAALPRPDRRLDADRAAAREQRRARRHPGARRPSAAARSRCTRTASTRRSPCRASTRPRIALRTQQVLAARGGHDRHRRPARRLVLRRGADRRELEREAPELIERIDELGGAVAAIEAGLRPGRDRGGRLPLPGSDRGRRARRSSASTASPGRPEDASSSTASTRPASSASASARRGVRSGAQRRRRPRRRSPRSARRADRHGEPPPAAARSASRPLHGRRDLRRAPRALGHLRRPVAPPETSLASSPCASCSSRRCTRARAPDLGSFVATLERALEVRGHDLARAVVDRPGGRGRHARLALDVFRTARPFRPDVVYAHFLVPAGLLAAIAGRARSSSRPTARTSRTRASTRRPCRDAPHGTARRTPSSRCRTGSATVSCEAVPDARAKSTVIDCGVDLERFAAPRRGGGAGRPRLVARGNRLPLRRLADRAQERAARSHAPSSARRRAARVRRRRAAAPGARGTARDRPRRWRPARRRCRRGSQPPTSSASRASPSRSGSPRSRRSRRVVRSSRRASVAHPSSCRRRPGSSSIPTDDAALEAALGDAARLDRPNLTARQAAEAHDVRLQAERVEQILLRAVEIGEPELDERRDGLLEPGRPGRPRAPRDSSRAPSRARPPASAGCRRSRAAAGSWREPRRLRHGAPG